MLLHAKPPAIVGVLLHTIHTVYRLLIYVHILWLTHISPCWLIISQRSIGLILLLITATYNVSKGWQQIGSCRFFLSPQDRFYFCLRYNLQICGRRTPAWEPFVYRLTDKARIGSFSNDFKNSFLHPCSKISFFYFLGLCFCRCRVWSYRSSLRKIYHLKSFKILQISMIYPSFKFLSVFL